MSSVKAFAAGFVGFRTWTLQAFDEKGNMIVEVKKNFGIFGNSKKLDAFQTALKDKGYKLKDDQLQDLSDKLNVNFQDALKKLKDLAPDVKEVVDIYKGGSGWPSSGSSSSSSGSSAGSFAPSNVKSSKASSLPLPLAAQ